MALCACAVAKLPHPKDSCVEVEGHLGVLDSHHGLLHNEVTALCVRLFAGAFADVIWERASHCVLFPLVASSHHVIFEAKWLRCKAKLRRA